MGKKRNAKKKPYHTARSQTASMTGSTSSCGGGGGGDGGTGVNHKYSVFEFSQDELNIENDARKFVSKLTAKSPCKRPAFGQPVEKYDFLISFGGDPTQQNDPGKETSDVDISDDFLEDRVFKHDVTPGSLIKSLSISVNPHGNECSSRRTTRSCAYSSSKKSGGHKTEKKHKLALHIDSDEDRGMDSQSSISSRLAENKGSLEEGLSLHGFNGNDCEAVVIVSPKYIKCRNIYYTKCSLSFSSRSIRLEGLPLHDRKKLHHLYWSTFDIIQIEHRPCESVKADVVNLKLTSKDANYDENCSRKSGIMELEFVVIHDPQWSKKQEEIKSLNVKYETAWETIISKCSFKEKFDDIIYPEDNPDAVFIRKSDVERLQPELFLNDTIIDFYTKYLVNELTPEEQKRFHFFTTFFFRKLADINQVFSNTCEAKQAFQRVRKWTRNLKLFEKDFIFIPVNFSLHWSLIVICHPRELANLTDKDGDEASIRPCILHMDSIRGSHGGFEKLIRGYLWEEWKMRYGKQDADIEGRFFTLPFHELKLPQQENFSDCGLFLLHYAELFLAQAANFRTADYFNCLNEDWFVPAEVSLRKRDHIRKLIHELAEHQALKNPPAVCNDNHVSSSVDGGDSSVEIINRNNVKETYDDMKFNPCIDHQIKGLCEPENTSKFWKDQSVEPCKQLVSNNQLRTLSVEQEEIEMESNSSPGVSTSRYEAYEYNNKSTPPSRSISSFRVGDMEVPYSNTSKTCDGVSQMIINLQNDDEDHVTKVASSTPEKRNSSSLSSEVFLLDCIVEDSEEENVIQGSASRINRKSCLFSKERCIV